MRSAKIAGIILTALACIVLANLVKADEAIAPIRSVSRVNGQMSLGEGTAFAIATTDTASLWMTCGHLAKDGATYAVIIGDRSVPAEQVASVLTSVDDVALYQINEPIPEGDLIEIAPDAVPPTGSTVRVRGLPAGTHGRKTVYGRLTERASERIWIDSPVIGGMSGSPMMTQIDGRWVAFGVMMGSMRDRSVGRRMHAVLGDDAVVKLTSSQQWGQPVYQRCPPGGPCPVPIYSQPMPIVTQPDPVTIAGPPGPQGPPGNDGRTPSQQELVELILAIMDADPERFKGRDGKTGLAGPPGKNGESPDVSAEVERILQSKTVRVIMVDGTNILDDESYSLFNSASDPIVIDVRSLIKDR